MAILFQGEKWGGGQSMSCHILSIMRHILFKVCVCGGGGAPVPPFLRPSYIIYVHADYLIDFIISYRSVPRRMVNTTNTTTRRNDMKISLGEMCTSYTLGDD